MDAVEKNHRDLASCRLVVGGCLVMFAAEWNNIELAYLVVLVPVKSDRDLILCLPCDYLEASAAQCYGRELA